MVRRNNLRARVAGALPGALLAVVCGLQSACLLGASAADDEAARQREIARIRETLHQYAMFLDDGRVEDFLDLFTPDAVFTADEFVYDGREAIRVELAEKPRGPGRHLPFPALIELESPTVARAWSDFLRVKIEREGDPTAWAITSAGRYYDRLVKGDDGRWRFSRRDVYILAMKNRSDLVEPPGSR